MKNRLAFYPIIRRKVGTMKELGEVINRSESYCKKRMNGTFEFSQRELNMIAEYLHVDVTELKPVA